MKRNVRKKILLLTVCTMIVGALLLTGCRPKNEIDDPWLKLWQEVVINRDVKVTSVAFDYYTFKPEFSHPERVISNDKKQIKQLLNELSAVGSDFTEDPYGEGIVEQLASTGQRFVYIELYTENNDSLSLWIVNGTYFNGYNVCINQSAERKGQPDTDAEPLFVYNGRTHLWNFNSASVFYVSDNLLKKADYENIISIFYANQ